MRRLLAVAITACVAAGPARADEGEPPKAPASPPGSPGSIDPFGARARGVSPLAPFGLRADAAPKPPAVSARVSTVPPDTVAVGGACVNDVDCAGRAYCDGDVCKAVQHGTSALIYWHRPGDRGYRYVIPIYFRWWSHDGNGRVVFPFYWHFHDYRAATVDTVMPLWLYQHHEEPGFVADRVWPLFFYHRYGEGGKDGSGVGLIPLFWASRKKERTTGVAPLLLSGWSSDRKTGNWWAWAGLLSYFERTGERTFGTVFPLVWHVGSGHGATTVVLPLGLFGEDHKTGLAHGTLIPFFHYRSEEFGRRKLLVSPLAVWSRNEDTGTRQLFLPVPLYYQRRDRQREIDFLAPLVLRWHDKRDRTTTSLFGPYLRYDDPAGSTEALLPLFYRFRDEKAGAETGFAIPLAVWHQTPTESGHLIGPFYEWQDPKGWSRGLFPILFLQDRGGRSHQVLLPLFVHARDKNAGTQTTGVGPFFLHTERQGFDTGLFPVVFGGRHKDAFYGTVAGIYVVRGDAHGQTHVLGPLYAGSRDDGYVVGLAPIFHASRKGDRHLSWFLPPLYLHSDDRKAKSEFTMFGPVFRDREGADMTQGVFPIAWGVDRGPKHWDVFLPLVAHTVDKQRQTEALVVGPYGQSFDGKKQKSTKMLFPLIVKHDAPNYHVLVQFPFFWRVREGSETDTVVFPFYARQHRPDSGFDVAFPLFWRIYGKNSKVTILGPLAWRTKGDRQDGALLPLFGWGGKPGKRYTWILPLLFWHDTDEAKHESRTGLITFYWERRADGWTSIFLPFWTGWKKSGRSHVIGPGFYHGEDAADGKKLTVLATLYFGGSNHSKEGGLAPLFFFGSHDDGRWNATLFPLFHLSHKKDGGTRFFTLLGGVSTSPAGTKGFIGPIYFRAEREGYSGALIPLFYHSHDRFAGTSTTVLLPLFLRHSTPEKSLIGVTPLIWRYRTIESSTTFGFPLFFDQHYFHESRTTGVVPLYIRHKNYATGAQTSVVPPLLMYIKQAPEGTDFAFFPLIWRLVGKNGSHSTVAFPLFFDFKRGSSTTQVLFPLYMHAVRENATHTLVLNVYYRKGRGQLAGTYYLNVFPFFDVGHPRPQDLEWNILGGAIGYSRIGRNRTLKLLYAIDIPLQPVPLRTSLSGSSFNAATSSKERGNDLF